MGGRKQSTKKATAGMQSPCFVPRAEAKESVAIVSCEFLFIVLADRKLGLYSVSWNNTRKW